MIFQKPFPLRWPALLATLALSLAAIPTAALAQEPEQTARLVRDSNPDPLSYGVGINWVAPLGDRAVFSRSFLNGSRELWISNGTPKGTLPIRQAPLGPELWYTGGPVPFGTGTNAKVAFHRISASEGEYKEVWVTDGTDAGTRRVSPSPAIQIVHSLTGTTTGVFFVGYADGDSDSHLYFSDGTAEGTRPLNPIVEESTSRFSEPSVSFTTGPWCYFIANQNEVWRSDGTDAGTTKIATFPITAYSILSAWAADTRMFVASRDYDTGTHQVWSCPLDGGSITHAYPPAGEDAWKLLSATTLGEQLFFSAMDHEGYVHLIVSDGTEAGTREIPIPLREGLDTYDINFTRWHGAVYAFVTGWDGEAATPSYALYRIDGTNDELTSLATFSTQAGFHAETAWREQQDFLYFTVTNANGEGERWQTKGTAATTRKAKGIPARHYLRAEWDQYVTASTSGIYYAALGSANTSGLSLWFQPHGKSGRAKRLTLPEKWTGSGIPVWWWNPYPYKSLTYDMFDGRLLSFVSFGNSITDDRELWSMNPDGSRAKAIWKAPGTMDGNDAYFGFWGTTPLGSIFYYSDGHETRRIYRTNGTRGGTRLMKEHGTGPDQGLPWGFAQSGDQVFYSVTSWDTTDTTLWKTDGTPEGTMKIVAADGTVPKPIREEKMASFQGNLHFLAHRAGGGFQLWRTDGTPAGTIMLKESSTGTPAELTVAGGKLLFVVKFYQSFLWQSDGTAVGTIPVPGAPGFPFDNPPAGFTDLGNGVVLFQASATRTGDHRWWRHDATGTYQLPIDMTGRHFFYDNWDQYHAVVGNKVIYYAYDDESEDDSLWITDGTVAGTHRISPPATVIPTGITSMLAVGNQVYFNGWDPTHGRELWRTDGTAAGTALVADIDPSTDIFSSSPTGFKVMDGKLYFSANRNDVGYELFVVDLPAE